eukprot:CAMPEP_0119562104 /NCGR_PEP_ID=MMETSP1352-20130426/19532_1 /TAXON_ID=265584 /ORGANISM="Stauroneis constricta, Strain CCMP1120" /LENGTH=550 /DNA_ID=CAMNT_0007610451 /DNA_START=37 /DNA_END=1689 /DNA_ORIENTATION=-
MPSIFRRSARSPRRRRHSLGRETVEQLQQQEGRHRANDRLVANQHQFERESPTAASDGRHINASHDDDHAPTLTPKLHQQKHRQRRRRTHSLPTRTYPASPASRSTASTASATTAMDVSTETAAAAGLVLPSTANQFTDTRRSFANKTPRRIQRTQSADNADYGAYKITPDGDIVKNASTDAVRNHRRPRIYSSSNTSWISSINFDEQIRVDYIDDNGDYTILGRGGSDDDGDDDYDTQSNDDVDDEDQNGDDATSHTRDKDEDDDDSNRSHHSSESGSNAGSQFVPLSVPHQHDHGNASVISDSDDYVSLATTAHDDSGNNDDDDIQSHENDPNMSFDGSDDGGLSCSLESGDLHNYDDDDDDDDSGEYLQQLNDTPSGHGNSPPTRYARTAKTRNSTTSSSSSSKSAHGPRMVDDANTSRTTRSVTSVRSAPHMASTNSDNNNNHKQRDSKASPSSIPKSVRIVDKSNPIYKLQKQRRKTVVRGVVGGAVAGVVLGPIGIVGGAVAGGMVASSYAKQRERKDYRKMEKQVLQGMALDDERLVRQGYYV